MGLVHPEGLGDEIELPDRGCCGSVWLTRGGEPKQCRASVSLALQLNMGALPRWELGCTPCKEPELAPPPLFLVQLHAEISQLRSIDPRKVTGLLQRSKTTVLGPRKLLH